MKTKRVKVETLLPPALDWAVAQCEGHRRPRLQLLRGNVALVQKDDPMWCDYLQYSQLWEQGGPIIQRELLQINPAPHYQIDRVNPNWQYYGFKEIQGWHWEAFVGSPNNIDENYESYGDTPLIAAMRCYVASKRGEYVRIPVELLEQANAVTE